MENLTEVFDPASNSFWNLLLAVGVVIVSIVVARYVRRATRRHLGRYEGLDDYAGAVLGRLVGPPIGPVTGSRAWVTWARWRRPMCGQLSFGRVMARSSIFPTPTY